jgi:Cys-tRNA(Pro)/Cys-tRNA(Cys) deacylase
LVYTPSHVEQWVKKRGLGWRIHRLETSVRTVAQASRAVRVSPKEIVKTIIAVDGDRTIACIIPGDKRLDLKRLSMLIEGEPRIASPREVLERTGYTVGGVPPVSLPENVLVVLDESVLENERVFAGGGDEKTLLEFNPRELAETIKPIVAIIAR